MAARSRVQDDAVRQLRELVSTLGLSHVVYLLAQITDERATLRGLATTLRATLVRRTTRRCSGTPRGGSSADQDRYNGEHDRRVDREPAGVQSRIF